MKRSGLTRFRVVSGIAIFGVLFLVGGIIEGHAVLKESNPAANSKVKGPDVPIMLRYNVRINAKLSKLQLLHPDNSISDLKIDTQSCRIL